MPVTDPHRSIAPAVGRALFLGSAPRRADDPTEAEEVVERGARARRGRRVRGTVGLSRIRAPWNRRKQKNRGLLEAGAPDGGEGAAALPEGRTVPDPKAGGVVAQLKRNRVSGPVLI